MSILRQQIKELQYREEKLRKDSEELYELLKSHDSRIQKKLTPYETDARMIVDRLKMKYAEEMLNEKVNKPEAI